MKEYQSLFIDEEYPSFIDKYLSCKTLERLKHVTQFCGADYTNLYSPLFLYTRYDHSITVAHMTWHFTHDKKSTIAALLHDVGTPCFAHTIDYVFGDYMNQESSEKDIVEMIKKDKDLMQCLKEDNMDLELLKDLTQYSILENKSPRLCADRLDGVLHTCYIWLHTHPLDEIKEVYEDTTILINEDGKPEIGFKHKMMAIKFAKMVIVYAKELWGNKDKYVSKYISEMVKASVERNLITLEDLYIKKESEIAAIFDNNFSSWKKFNKASILIGTETTPTNFYVSVSAKKRNVIPLVWDKNKAKRIDEASLSASKIYRSLEGFSDSTYAYVEEIIELL